MNDALRLVAPLWYRIFYTIAIGLAVLTLAAVIAARFMPGVADTATTFGLTTVSGVLAGLTITYNSSLYWWVRRRSRPIAALVTAILVTILLLYGLNLTNQSDAAWVYVGIWTLIAFFWGMFGLPCLLAPLVLVGLFVLLEDALVWDHVTPVAGLVAISIVMIPLNILFWRRRYVGSSDDSQLNKLSGMLRNKEDQAAILIQSVADGVIVTDTEGKITLMNRTAANMTGWTVEEALGVDVRSVLKLAKEKGEPIPDNEYPFTAVLVHKAFINQILQVTDRNNQKKVIVSLTISPVVTQSGEVFGTVAVVRDISEARAAEQQRGEFISTASHEMRTPVAAIEGYLSLALNDKVSTIDSRARGYLEKAHSSTQHLGKLFQDLLTSAKAEDGRLSSHPQVIEMGTYLEQMVEDFRFAAQKKSLQAEFTLGNTGDTIDATATNENNANLKVVKPLYYVYADPERLREVITNLFDNAVKYTDQGKVTIGLTGNNEVVQIYVRDTGQGIPAEDIPHLFQKFYRVDNSATRVIGGTGLGLFISRKIVELYQGRVWVESELGKGSTFYINLPRLSTQKASELQATEAASVPAAPAPTATTTPKP